MSNNYVDAPACRMLATSCCACGRPLLDARSVELGIGPDCRGQYGTEEVDEGQRRVCNQLTWAAAVFAERGEVADVRRCADAIEAVGLSGLANTIRARFRAAERQAHKIVVRWADADHSRVVVVTPFRRGERDEFLHAWRSMPGRRYHGAGENSVPNDEATLGLVRALLARFFPGRYATWLGGIWRIPGKEA